MAIPHGQGTINPAFRPSALDGNQVLQYAFDEPSCSLRTQATVSLGATEVIIDHADDSIRLGDGTNLVTVTNVSGKYGLDVNLLNNDFDIRDLDANQDNIAISDGTNSLQITSNGGIVTNNTDTSLTIFNVSAPVANTEYSVTLPNKTKKFLMRSRNKGVIQFTNVNGATGTQYITLKANTVYTDNCFYENLTIYFRSTKTNDILELIAYV